MDDYLKDFVQESEEQITDLNNALLDLENDPNDEDAMERIFRTAHTLKGNCGAMGFTAASDLAHAIEDLLEEMRAGRVTVTPTTMDEVFEGVDTLEAMIDEVREHEEPQTDPREVVDSLRETIEEAPGADARIEEPSVEQIEAVLEEIEGPSHPEQRVYYVRLAVTEEQVQQEGMLVLEALADAFDVLATNPPQNVIRKEDYGNSFDAVIASAIGIEDITAALEAVNQVDDVLVDDVTDEIEADIEGEEIDVEDMEVEELLESVSEFDDIEARAEELAEEEAMEELGDAGTFEEVEVEPEEEIEIEGLLEDEDIVETEEIEESDLGPMEDLEPEEPQDANEVFRELQDEVDEVAYEELEPELEELEFDEFSEEDELGLDELMAEAGEIEADDLDAFESEFDEAESGVDEEVEAADADVAVSEAEVDDLIDEGDTSVTDEEVEELLEEGEAEAEEDSGVVSEAFEAASDVVSGAFGGGAEAEEYEEAEAIEEPEVPGEPDEAATAGSELAEIESIRVDVGQVDTLLNQVEELVTNRIRLRQAIESGSIDVAIDELDDLETLTMRMQDTVMDIRLVPLEQVVGRLPRVVRDIAREQDKEVDFAVRGGDVELDRRILSELGDPLMHLVRNAVDHGIESPEEREEEGKPRQGQITLSARRSRDRVTIEISDDGRGFDTEAIARQAVQEGIVTEETIDEMDTSEIHELVFEPGFTTAEEVTGVSGRGVGMDVVRETVQSLDGAVSVDSTPGEGTTVHLRVPVSVAIVRVLFVESGGEEYGIPVKNVDEISRMGAIESVEGEEVLTHEDKVYPLIRLDEALGTDGRGRNGAGMLIRVDDDVRQVALHCDAVRRQEEVVVKPFEGLLSGIPGLSGAAVLGEGDVVTILDVETL